MSHIGVKISILQINARAVNDIMSQNFVTTTPSTTMDMAAKTMGEKHIGSLVVLRGGEPIGIVTERIC